MLSDEGSAMLVLLKDADGPVGSNEIENRIGVCQWCVFECSMELLKDGIPVSLHNCEGSWLNFTESEGEVSYSLTSRTDDLEEMKEMVAGQLKYLTGIRTGIEKALAGCR
jgi:hypothetical protein